ncbi:MAG: hypothetical protein WCK18_15895 [Prolixibacteraceae bacterium]|jgi:hypothetical protein
MKDFLIKEFAAFYHITTCNKLTEIQQYGLRSFNGKGISVIRTNDMRIVNSIIALQLYTPEVEKENNFILLRIPQKLNNFKISQIQPDIVLEWTWPLHNNIVNTQIPFDRMEIEKQFKIDNWNQIYLEDPKNEKEIKQMELYTDSFKLVYSFNHRNFFVDEFTNKIYI